jgi:hypothetical protein
LRLALYKIKTNQAHTPFLQLPYPANRNNCDGLPTPRDSSSPFFASAFYPLLGQQNSVSDGLPSPAESIEPWSADQGEHDDYYGKRPKNKRSIAKLNNKNDFTRTPNKAQALLDIRTVVTPLVHATRGYFQSGFTGGDFDLTSSAIKEAPGTVGAARGLLNLGKCWWWLQYAQTFLSWTIWRIVFWLEELILGFSSFFC